MYTSSYTFAHSHIRCISSFNYLSDLTGALPKSIPTTHNLDHVTQIINSQIQRYNQDHEAHKSTLHHNTSQLLTTALPLTHRPYHSHCTYSQLPTTSIIDHSTS
ncbi:hypothetical protein LINPERPRIM_LOCUS8505, partial [Linum perenne]